MEGLRDSQDVRLHSRLLTQESGSASRLASCNPVQSCNPISCVPDVPRRSDSAMPGLHSHRSARTGSSFAARRAGSHVASAPTERSTAETARSVTGSVGVTP
jgi:hypothetical protein